MGVQSTYPDTQPKAVAGLQATMIAATILSRSVEVAAIGFGVAVEQGTADKGCIKFDGGTVLGITVLDRGASGRTVTAGQLSGEIADQYGIGESARVMVKGDVWVTVAANVVAGNPVYVRPSNGDFQPTNANSAIQIVGARFDTTASSGGLAVVRLG